MTPFFRVMETPGSSLFLLHFFWLLSLPAKAGLAFLPSLLRFFAAVRCSLWATFVPCGHIWQVWAAASTHEFQEMIYVCLDELLPPAPHTNTKRETPNTSG